MIVALICAFASHRRVCLVGVTAALYPEARVDMEKDGIVLHPSAPEARRLGTSPSWTARTAGGQGLTRSAAVTWAALHAQFGAGFEAARQLKPTFREALALATAFYPEARVILSLRSDASSIGSRRTAGGGERLVDSDSNGRRSRT